MITVTYVDDTAILAVNKSPVEAIILRQNSLHKIEKWAKKSRMQLNETKSTHITFTKCHGTTSIVKLNNKEIPVVDSVKHFGHPARQN